MATVLALSSDCAKLLVSGIQVNVEARCRYEGIGGLLPRSFFKAVVASQYWCSVPSLMLMYVQRIPAIIHTAVVMIVASGHFQFPIAATFESISHGRCVCTRARRARCASVKDEAGIAQA